MKKILSILGAIGLTATSTTNLVACNTPKSDNNNENGGNKTETTSEPQQPPLGSKWKNIPRTQAPNKEFLTATNKWYFYISKKSNEYITEKIYFDNNFINNKNTWWQHLKNDSNFIWNYNSVYRWDGDDNPKLPEIDKNTGKILKWNEKTD